MTEKINETIQNVTEEVVENVKPNFVEAILNNQRLMDGILITGSVCGIAYGVSKTVEFTKTKVLPKVASVCNGIKEKMGSKKNNNPIEDLKEVVEEAVQA